MYNHTSFFGLIDESLIHSHENQPVHNKSIHANITTSYYKISKYDVRVIFMYIPPNTELPSSATQRVPVTSQTTQKFLAVAAYY